MKDDGRPTGVGVYAKPKVSRTVQSFVCLIPQGEGCIGMGLVEGGCLPA